MKNLYSVVERTGYWVREGATAALFIVCVAVGISVMCLCFLFRFPLWAYRRILELKPTEAR